MSARCSSLHDAIRTAAVRGLRSDAIEDTRKAYQTECAAEEGEAQSQLANEHREKTTAKNEVKSASNMSRRQALEKEQQCGESKRILFAMRARTDLNEGEKAELKRFTENYLARCS